MLTHDNSTCISEVLTMLAHYKDRALPSPFLGHMLRGFLAALALAILTHHAQAATQTTTMVIQNQNGTVVSGLNISTTKGPCIQIINSTNITIKQSQIGPCGDNNTTNNSQGIYITGSTGVNIYDSYIHVENQSSTCGDSHDSIQIANNPGPVVIQGNVIAYGGNNIHAWDASNISVIGNFLLNPRGAASCGDPDNLQGNQFQAWADPGTPNSNLTVSNNYTISAPTGYLYPGAGSDEISFGFTNGFIAKNNWVNGAQNPTACGIIGDDAVTNGQITGNVINETFNCGIGIASGTGHVISSNKVLITKGSTSTAGIVINGSYGLPCNTITVSFNDAYTVTTSGWVQGYWDSGTCTGVTLTSNVFDVGCTVPSCTAYKALNPLTSTSPPPLIPPQPFACVATSPYSTQTSAPLCSGGGSTSPPGSPPPTPPTATLTASPTSIATGSSATLSWGSSNATSCGGSNFTASGLSGSAVTAPSATTTYTVTCSGAGGSASATAQVSVTAPTASKHKR
jgi:hypothetical protein